jgi:hypothetical protein
MNREMGADFERVIEVRMRHFDALQKKCQGKGKKPGESRPNKSFKNYIVIKIGHTFSLWYESC